MSATARLEGDALRRVARVLKEEAALLDPDSAVAPLFEEIASRLLGLREGQANHGRRWDDA